MQQANERTFASWSSTVTYTSVVVVRLDQYIVQTIRNMFSFVLLNVLFWKAYTSI